MPTGRPFPFLSIINLLSLYRKTTLKSVNKYIYTHIYYGRFQTFVSLMPFHCQCKQPYAELYIVLSIFSTADTTEARIVVYFQSLFFFSFFQLMCLPRKWHILGWVVHPQDNQINCIYCVLSGLNICLFVTSPVWTNHLLRITVNSR